MASGFRIRKNQYFDSVFLMGINQRLSEEKGVKQSAVLMCTENNKGLLADIGIESDEISNAKANDLIVAIIAKNQETINRLFENIDNYFISSSAIGSEVKQRTLDDGLRILPNANLAVISVPGQYAAREAKKALDSGLQVFIFSDNVPLDEEIELKQKGYENQLLVMGPDCGTSIINGTCIGFANKVRKGVIGVIGASGTGIQEFTSQVHNFGSGISQAIGTGSRDLHDDVGGLTTITALKALDADPSTQMIVIVSKPPGLATLDKINQFSKNLKKPVVGCFLGLDIGMYSRYENFNLVSTIDDAVSFALSKIADKKHIVELNINDGEVLKASLEREKFSPKQKYVRGIFSGGTFCYQSQQIFQNAGLSVFSNGPIDNNKLLPDPDQSIEHTFVDMGDEYYTVGTPHPMIDGKHRRERILREGEDPQAAIILMDFVLGYNASLDPVGDVIDSIIEAKRIVEKRGDYLCVVASICGTDEDPQDLKQQIDILMDAGVFIFRSNVKATLFCTKVLD